MSAARETCAFCRNRYGACVCGFPEPDGADLEALVQAGEAFDTGDMIITAPNVSECGRYFVEPVLAYGDAWLAYLTPKGRTIKGAHACGACGYIDAGNTCCKDGE